MDQNTLALFGLWYVVFLLSTTCHEAAHAFAAMRGGDWTAAHGGQASLNPVPHIRREPFGMVLVPLLTYFTGGWMLGWASAPYDPRWQAQYPKRAALMALAGPVANFLLVLLAALLIHAGLSVGVFTPPAGLGFAHLVDATGGGAWDAAGTLLSILFSLNVLLGVFNLLPVPPLDGASAIGLILPDRLALRFMQLSHSPMFALIGLLIAWQFFNPIFMPVFRLAVGMLYPGRL